MYYPSLPLSVLQTIAAIFLLGLVGYGAKRVRVLKPADASVVNAIVIYLTMPAFIFTAIHKKPLIGGLWTVPVVAALGQFAVMGLAYAIARLMKLDRRTTGGLMVAAAFGNTGFLGYPVTIAAWPDRPEALVTSVVFDEFAMALWLNSAGIAVAACFGSSNFEWHRMLEFLKTPLFPATVLSFILRDVPVPEPVIISMKYLGAATIPLAMLSLGLSISAKSTKGMTRPFIACFLLKTAVLPLLLFFGLKFIGVGGVVRDAAVLEACMPSAVMSGVVAGRYGTNGPFVSGTVFLMTLFSLVTIPVVLSLLH